MSSPTHVVSDEVWNAFWDAHRADLHHTTLLLDDDTSLAAIAAVPSHLAPEPYGSLNDADDELNRAITRLEQAAPLPNSEQAKLVAEDGRAIRDTIVDANTKVTNAAHELKNQSSPSTDAWDAQMADLEKSTIDASTKRIHDAFTTLRKRGDDHPEERPFLLKIGQGLRDFIGLLGNLLQKAAEWLKSQLEAIWNAVKQAAQWVWDKLTRAARAVGAFFGL